MAAIYGGRTLIIQRQFEPVEWMTLVQEEKANRAMMVPTMLKMLMDHQDFENYDLYIVASSIVCCETEIDVIKKIKSIEGKVFAIGPFATNQPKIYNDAGATVILGEPEFYFLKKKEYKNDLKKKIVSFDHSYELDDLPYPDWKAIITDPKKVSKLFGNYSTIPMLATRGCPYSCFKYCVYPLQQGRKVRQRSPKKIVDEMEY